VALPAAILVRYTEEEAGFVSLRPVPRLTLAPAQLLELILGVTGKTRERVRQILRGGTIVSSGYRYWWEGLEVATAELESLLQGFPDADPSRAFDPARCTAVVAESDPGKRTVAEFEPRVAARRRLFRRQSFWEVLLAAARVDPPVYQDYSYLRRGDLYVLVLEPERRVSLGQAARRLGVGELRARAAPVEHAARLVYVCSR
jgi:hypothetical protein